MSGSYPAPTRDTSAHPVIRKKLIVTKDGKAVPVPDTRPTTTKISSPNPSPEPVPLDDDDLEWELIDPVAECSPPTKESEAPVAMEAGEKFVGPMFVNGDITDEEVRTWKEEWRRKGVYMAKVGRRGQCIV